MRPGSKSKGGSFAETVVTEVYEKRLTKNHETENVDPDQIDGHEAYSIRQVGICSSQKASAQQCVAQMRSNTHSRHALEPHHGQGIQVGPRSHSSYRNPDAQKIWGKSQSHGWK